MSHRRSDPPNPEAAALNLARALRASPIAARLDEATLAAIESSMHERALPTGAHVARKGDAADHWVLVIDGMVKVEAAAVDGRRTTLIGVTEAGWLGESALLSDGLWPFDVVATRPTRLGLLPRNRFEDLLAQSLPFSRCLLDQLNARLQQFARRCEHLRFAEAGEHVAHCLGELFDARLYPGTGRRLALSQDEVAHLAGISRPTAHRALHELELRGVLSVGYGAITVHDPQALRRFGSLH